MKKNHSVVNPDGGINLPAATERVTCMKRQKKVPVRLSALLIFRKRIMVLLFTPALNGLPPACTGFTSTKIRPVMLQRKRVKPVPALAAGGHFDPQVQKFMPVPYAGRPFGRFAGTVCDPDDGKATTQVLAPRLKKLREIKGHAIMVHAGGDNHSGFTGTIRWWRRSDCLRR